MSEEHANNHPEVLQTLNQMRSFVSELVDRERLPAGESRKLDKERKVQISGRVARKHKDTLERHYSAKLSAVVERLLTEEARRLLYRRAFGDSESWSACVDWSNLRHSTELPANLWTLRVRGIGYYVFDSQWNLLSLQPDLSSRTALSTMEILAYNEQEEVAAVHWDGRPRKVYFLPEGQFSMATCPASEVFKSEDGTEFVIYVVGERRRWSPRLSFALEPYLSQEKGASEWSEASPRTQEVYEDVVQTLYLRAAELSLREEEFAALVSKARKLLAQLDQLSSWSHETCSLFVESLL